MVNSSFGQNTVSEKKKINCFIGFHHTCTCTFTYVHFVWLFDLNLNYNPLYLLLSKCSLNFYWRHYEYSLSLPAEKINKYERKYFKKKSKWFVNSIMDYIIQIHNYVEHTIFLDLLAPITTGISSIDQKASKHVLLNHEKYTIQCCFEWNEIQRNDFIVLRYGEIAFIKCTS